MRVRAILNPCAGLAARRALSALEEGVPSWPRIEVQVTEGPGDARRWASEAAEDGYDVVLAAGGDGTANEVGWGLQGSSTVLGLVPVGSGNGLARTLGISRQPERALRSLETAIPRRMDVGLVNDRPFLNVAGAGFDAVVGADFHERGQKGGRRGLLTYVRLSLARSLSYRANSWILTAGGEQFQGRAFIVAFVNGRQYGGAAMIAPGARLDDGLLDIVVIEDAPPPELILNALRLYTGTIEGFRRYRRMASSVAILSSTGPFAHHRDGEPEPAAERLEVRIASWALRILVPRVVAEDPSGPFGARGLDNL